jgi:GNAT superfamily N-acetyltransferase
MDNLIIRLALQQDKEQIIHFNQAMALETENKTLNPVTLKAGVENLFAQPQYGFYCVAEMEGRVIGQLMITYEWSDWRNGLFWWIQSVYIHPDFRRKGIYRKLYGFILNESKKHQVCGIRLYVYKGNLPAKNTYLKCGMSASHYDLFEADFVPG